jgi:flagellar secretion chaperone FliS
MTAALRNPSRSYRHVLFETAPPGQLVLMLYDGVLRFLHQALQGFEIDDPADSNSTISNNVLRAQEIIRELNGSLNLPAGGDLAFHLRRVYTYSDQRLLQSNIKKEPAGIRDVMERFSGLRGAWAAMLGKQTSGAPEPSGAVSIDFRPSR